jgi:4-alpha-glucanotransferase
MNLISQLAEIVGFHSSYTGAFGDQVVTSDSAKRTLLKEMGFNIEDDKTLKANISFLNQKQWLNILPDVHIAKLEQEDQPTIKISLPITDITVLKWHIDTESGDKLFNAIPIADLKTLSTSSINAKQYAQYELPLPKLIQGYHKLTVSMGDTHATCPLIFAPKECYSPKEASAKKVWGYTAQLYSLHSKSNWGIGDFSDLYELVNQASSQQASLIGLNPLHPLYQQNPAHRSPYSPSSRSFLNPLYIDFTKVPNFEHCELVQKTVKSKAFKQSIDHLKASDLIDYPGVAKLKYGIAELLFEDLYDNQHSVCKVMSIAFNAFKKAMGEDLVNLSTFDALNEYFNLKETNVYGWNDWPEAFHDPESDDVKKFQQTHSLRIDYFCFLQWIAHTQLKMVSERTKEKGMAIGLYLDLAVGCDGAGVDVWSDKTLYVAGASIGAPPDSMNLLGQNWGLTPLNPVELQKQGYQPLVKALRSNMQYAGALRIDHILGLMRQYWVAPGFDAKDGVYISFPLDDILRIIALESRRNNCVVIGEDLGNVPEGFSAVIQNAGLLSFKVMFFERWESGLFKRPDQFPSQSIITVATHDTPTLTGWWQGRDLEWRQQLDLYPNEAAGQADRDARNAERENLIAALEDLNVMDMKNVPQKSPAKMNTELSIAVQKYLAAANSHIQLIPLEDMLEMPEQVNIPGTIDQHPNWLQKLPVLLEDFWQAPTVQKIAEVMQNERPK